MEKKLTELDMIKMLMGVASDFTGFLEMFDDEQERQAEVQAVIDEVEEALNL